MHALNEAELILRDLAATVATVRHLACNHPEEAPVEAWGKLAVDLDTSAEKLEELFDRAMDERTALVQAHKNEVAAVEDRKAAPGSKEDREQAAALWRMLRSMIEVAGRQCGVAGYPMRPERLEEDAPIGFVDEAL